jgi:hypothetical protein
MVRDNFKKNIYNHLQVVQGFNCRWMGPVGPLLRISWLKGLVAFLARGAKEKSSEASKLLVLPGRMMTLQDKIVVEPGKKR